MPGGWLYGRDRYDHQGIPRSAQRGYCREKSGEYGLGFVKNPEGTYNMVGDWWGISGKGEKQIAEKLQQQAESIQKEYAKKMGIEQTAADGFDLVSETEENDGTVRIVVRRWK